MAGWLSSKLKVAEDFFQQIDQQAAESLGKQEKPARSHDLHALSETPPLQSLQFKQKNLHETPELFCKLSFIDVQSEKPRQAKHFHGLKKSSPIAPILQEEVKSPRVSKPPLPVLGNDDWTQLLGSPQLPACGSNVGTSSKGAYNNSNRITNVGIPTLSSKNLLSNSLLARTSQQLDASSAPLRPLHSKEIARQDSKLSQLDVTRKVDRCGSQGVTAATGAFKHSNELEAVPDSSYTIQGNGSDSFSSSSSSEVSTKGWGRKGNFQANEDVKQNNEVPSTSRHSICASDAKEDHLTRARPSENFTVASPKSAFDSHDRNPDISSCSQNGGVHEVKKLHMSSGSSEKKDAGLIGISEKGIQQGTSSSYGISCEKTEANVSNLQGNNEHGQYRHSTERDRFATDALELKVDGIQSHDRQAKEIPAIELDGVHGSSSESDERSETQTDSASGSDSEDDEIERHKWSQRNRRAAEAAAEAAALEAAKTAIKERKEFVMRLEKEKERLEKILAERVEQQAREAAELQVNMKETMQAVDLEKQKHNVTRMEALTRVAKLETENAELAKSLAAVQRSLEVELNCVADLRREMESKEVAQAEFERRLSLLRHKLACSDQGEISKAVELEQAIFDEKSLHVSQKIEQLQVKAKQLEDNIERATEEWEGPTEVEVELERRLSQLTDHLIQKQAQVENLSAEKATLLFRLEALSNTLNEERNWAQSHISKGNMSSILLDSVSMGEDLEFGLARPCGSKRKEIYEHEDFVRSPIFFLFRQLDTILSAGAYYLRSHGLARHFSMVYLVALHIWVIFVLFLGSQENEDKKSGALFSLESINNATNPLNSTHS